MLKDEKMIFLVVNREEKWAGVIPMGMAELLKHYQDLMLDKIPKQLPPMRDMQHDIDIVPGLSLLNLPHYCMSPIKNEELRQQI